MASGEIDVIPGKQFGEAERVDNEKLNDLARPVLRIKEYAVTARELAPGAINADKLSTDISAQLGVADGSVTTNKIVDNAVTASKLADSARIPTGAIMDFAGSTPPDGWLLCGGQSVSRTTYALLFSVIGTTYGSVDGSSFTIPDLRGRVVAGKNDMVQGSSGRLTTGTINNPNALGGVGGEEMTILQTGNLPAHAHVVPNHSHPFSYTTWGSYQTMRSDLLMQRAVFWDSMTTANSGTGGSGDFWSQNTGSGWAHNNMPPAIIFNKIIRYL